MAHSALLRTTGERHEKLTNQLTRRPRWHANQTREAANRHLSGLPTRHLHALDGTALYPLAPRRETDSNPVTCGTLLLVNTRPILRIFISSTAVDLREYRDKVRDAVLRLEGLPLAMETFSAQSGQPAIECMQMAARSDAVICIVAHPYGYVPPPELGGDGERSITWLEVDAAKRAGKRVFVFLLDPKAQWNEVKEQDRLTSEPPEKAAEIVKAVQKLKEFKAYLENEFTRSTFSSADQLAQLVTATLANLVSQTGRAASNDSTRSASGYYFAVQSNIIQEYTRTFVGRVHAHQALETFLQNQKRGYFIIRAASDKGKQRFRVILSVKADILLWPMC